MNELKDFLDYYSDYILLLIIILVYLLAEFYTKRQIKKLEKKVYAKYDVNWDEVQDITSIDNLAQEDQLDYYKQKNILSLVRFWVLFFLFTFYLIHKLPNFFSFFAIAVWAIIVTFKDIILCFFWFFIVSTQYKIWENIILSEWSRIIRWEIIYINVLNIWVVWKDKNWEHNWQLYRIPNFKFFSEIIKKEEIALNKYQKEEILIYFDRDDFEISLKEFIDKLEIFLNENLQKRNLNNCWNYRTFIGHKYKLRFDYDDDKTALKLEVIKKPRDIFGFEKQLFSFIESLKIKTPKK